MNNLLKNPHLPGIRLVFFFIIENSNFEVNKRSLISQIGHHSSEILSTAVLKHSYRVKMLTKFVFKQTTKKKYNEYLCIFLLLH